jgi:hypothetical protein
MDAFLYEHLINDDTVNIAFILLFKKVSSLKYDLPN